MKCIVLGLLAALSVQTGYSAAFQNLGFDAGTTKTSDIGYDTGIGLVSGSGPIADLLPGWQLFAGTDRSPSIGYNSLPLGGPNATLISQDASAFYRFPIEGPYALLLDGGLLFQHDDGTVAVWLMDGINLISGQLLNPADPGSGWRIAGPR